MSSSPRIYLDYQATTPVDARVLEAMKPYFTEQFGNPSSISHEWGWRAQAGVDRARDQVAHGIGATSREILFTSGATESNNLAIQGVARAYETQGKHFITTRVEHKSVRDVFLYLEKKGFTVTWLDVDAQGCIDLEDLKRAIRKDTVMLSVIFANNEIGTIQPVKEIGKVCKEHKVFFHTDATQAAGKLPISVEEMGIDLLTFNAHKIYGPKGVGALYVRRKSPRVTLEPLVFGGGQERGLRSGTLNVPGVVGLGAAVELYERERTSERERVGKLADGLFEKLKDAYPDIKRNGHPSERLIENLSLAIPGVDAEALVGDLPGIAFSSGSACSSASLEPSYVLESIGLSEKQCQGTIRLSLGRFTTEAEIAIVTRGLIDAISRIRAKNRV